MKELFNLNIPDQFIDYIRQDILIDPIIAEDGNIYSKESILHWFGVCETQKLSYTSPINGIKIGIKLNEENILKYYIEIIKNKLNKFRRIKMTGCEILELENENERNNEIKLNFKQNKKNSKREKNRNNNHNSNSENENDNENDIIYCIHWLARLFIPIQKLSLSIRDIIPKWEAPQFVVIGEIGCGKSTFLERLSMMSLFPRGQDRQTCLPIHLKLRYATNYSPPIIRVIDPKRKVQDF